MSTLQEQVQSLPQRDPTKKLRVAMLQIEDRMKPYFEFCTNINREYCKKHEIDHIFMREGPENIPPYWWKVFVFYDLMKQGKHDIIVWMDSDAFVYSTKVDVRAFFKHYEQTMITCPDPYPWPSNFMAAVYMVRNDSRGQEIFQEWMNLYKPDKWRKLQNGKWRYIGNGQWAGIDYEQGSFAKIIMPKYDKWIKSLPWYVFHETNCHKPHENCWSIHIPGVIGTLRPNCIIAEQTRRKITRVNVSLFVTILLIVIFLITLGVYVYKS
jgi:hypothetical protein